MNRLYEVNFHRNGVAGTPFFVVLFYNDTLGEEERFLENAAEREE